MMLYLPRKVSGLQVRQKFRAGASAAHSLVNIVIFANLTLLSTSVKKFLVLSFIMVYHAPLGCP
jgi:hypothetical protein